MGKMCALLAVILWGCTCTSPSLVVDVKTDLVPGVEFTRVGATLSSTDDPPRMREVEAVPSDQFVDGFRAAVFDGLHEGSWLLEVALLDADGQTVAERPVRVQVRDDTAVTVLITRDCRGVACPLAGDDPSARACLGGRCVDPSCTEEHEDLCPAPECMRDADCPGGADCAEARCDRGTCLLVAESARCGPMAICRPDEGCQSIGPDAGVSDTLDAGVPDDWTRTFGGGGTDEAHGVALTTTGRVCVVGAFEGTIDAGGGPLVASGGSDAFVACYDADGSPAWSTRLGGAEDDVAAAVAPDDAGGIWVAGGFQGAVDVTVGTSTRYTATGEDGFLARFDADGSVRSFTQIGGDGFQRVYGVARAGAEVVIAGALEGTVSFGAAAGPVVASSRDAFVARLDDAGSARWAHGFGGGYDFALAVAVDDASNAWVTGAFEGELLPGGPTAVRLEDAFAVRLTADGDFDRTLVFGGTENEQGHGIGTVGGAVVFGGWFYGSARLQPSGAVQASGGAGDGFILQRPSTGAAVVHAFGAEGFERVLAVASDSRGACFAGKIESTVDWGSGSVTPVGSGDAVVACLDPAGSPRDWATFGGLGDDAARAVAVGPDGAVYVAGRFEQDARIGDEMASSVGGADVFVVRTALSREE